MNYDLDRKMEWSNIKNFISPVAIGSSFMVFSFSAFAESPQDALPSNSPVTSQKRNDSIEKLLEQAKSGDMKAGVRSSCLEMTLTNCFKFSRLCVGSDHPFFALRIKSESGREDTLPFFVDVCPGLFEFFQERRSMWFRGKRTRTWLVAYVILHFPKQTFRFLSGWVCILHKKT